MQYANPDDCQKFAERYAGYLQKMTGINVVVCRPEKNVVLIANGQPVSIFKTWKEALISLDSSLQVVQLMLSKK